MVWILGKEIVLGRESKGTRGGGQVEAAQLSCVSSRITRFDASVTRIGGVDVSIGVDRRVRSVLRSRIRGGVVGACVVRASSEKQQEDRPRTDFHQGPPVIAVFVLREISGDVKHCINPSIDRFGPRLLRFSMCSSKAFG